MSEFKLFLSVAEVEQPAREQLVLWLDSRTFSLTWDARWLFSRPDQAIG
jgi:hypothetical protein